MWSTALQQQVGEQPSEGGAGAENYLLKLFEHSFLRIGPDNCKAMCERCGGESHTAALCRASTPRFSLEPNSNKYTIKSFSPTSLYQRPRSPRNRVYINTLVSNVVENGGHDVSVCMYYKLTKESVHSHIVMT
ncbi:hypothetical protein B566_EDAN011065 [Ephemera danica]|nr:hypothetical protein B566_EDAN011065 [Ephemera danica]